VNWLSSITRPPISTTLRAWSRASRPPCSWPKPSGSSGAYDQIQLADFGAPDQASLVVGVFSDPGVHLAGVIGVEHQDRAVDRVREGASQEEQALIARRLEPAEVRGAVRLAAFH